MMVVFFFNIVLGCNKYDKFISLCECNPGRLAAPLLRMRSMHFYLDSYPSHHT